MVEMTGVPSRPRRAKNPRGQGHRLRAEIVSAAAAILERTGSEDGVTLRAIAREIGIAPQSIFHHFTDRAEIIDAVVAKQLAGLATDLRRAATGPSEPSEALFAAWVSYLRFGRDNPSGYRVIFERRFLPLWDEDQRPMTNTLPLFDETVAMMIGLLQACIDGKESSSTDAFADSVAIWYLAHGLVALPITITSFPWPDQEAHMRESVKNLAHLVRRE